MMKGSLSVVVGLMLLLGWIGLTAYGQSQPAAKATKATTPVEVVTLTRFGFEPSQITRPKGPFILAIENRSRVSLDVHLDRGAAKDASNRLITAPLPQNRPDKTNALDLAPGTYVLTDDNHPAWRCQIVIQP